MPETFESALQSRVDTMIDACTRCGKCVEACPSPTAAGLDAAARDNPVGVIGGVIDVLRGVKAARPRANGPPAAFAPAIASRPATTASIRAFCSAWRGQRWRAPRTTRRRCGRRASTASAMSRATSTPSRKSSSTRRCWRGWGRAPSRAPNRPARPARKPTSFSTPAATCSRRRISRCWRSTSWTRSASATR